MRITYVVIFLMLMCHVKLMGQDPSFSQIDNMTPYYHCSYLEMNSGVEARLAHRNQWNKADNGFSTYFLAASYKSEKTRSSFGLNIMQDTEGAGLLTTRKFDLVFRHKLPFSNKKFNSLTLGGYAGVASKSIDFDKLVFSDQIDPVFGIYQNSSQVAPNQEAAVFIDCGISITANYTLKVYEYKIPTITSVSLNHIFSDRDESIQQINTTLPALFVATISGTMQKSNLYNVPLLKPSVQYEQQANIHRIKAGSLVGFIGKENHAGFYAGIFYSMYINPNYQGNASAIIPVVGYEKSFNDLMLTFGYSYDVMIGGLTIPESGGTHEITLTVRFNTGAQKFRQPSNIFNKCPD